MDLKTIDVILKCLSTLASVIAMFMMVYKKKEAKQPSELIIGRPFGIPFVGNVMDLAPDALIESTFKYTAKYGKIFELNAFFQKLYFVSDIQLVKEMSLKRPKVFRRPIQLNVSGKVLGLTSGLFNTHGTHWNHVRKITSPTLAKHHVIQNTKQMVSEALLMVKSIDTRANGRKVVDVKDAMFLYTLGVIIHAAFGIEVDGELATYFQNKFAEDILSVFRFVIESIMFPGPNWLWKLIPHYFALETKAVQANDRYSYLFQKVIDKKRLELAENPEATNKHSVIDIMISKETSSESPDGSEVTDDEILANVKTFFLAGSETTSVTLTWALYFLSLNRKILKEAQEEVALLYTESDLENLTAEQLWNVFSVEKLPLCHAIIKETLRLHTPGSHNFMELEEGIKEFKLSNGMIIMPHDLVISCFDSIHWNEEYFEKASTFNPKRWWSTDAAVLSRMEGAFFAFGSGTRACPGMNLALIEAVIGLSAVIHHFDFELACPAAEIKRIMTFTAQPTKMPMTFTRRQL